MDVQRYKTPQIALHWAIAVLIAANWIFSEDMGRALEARLEGGLVEGVLPLFHTLAGGAIFVLVLIRIVLRLRLGAPPASPGTPHLLELAGTWGHRLLYLLMLVVPASGSAAWYVGIQAAGEAHEILVNLLLIVVVLHTAAALFHQYVLKDRLIARMMPGR